MTMVGEFSEHDDSLRERLRESVSAEKSMLLHGSRYFSCDDFRMRIVGNTICDC